MRLRSILRSSPGALESALASPADAVLLSVADSSMPVEMQRGAVRDALSRVSGEGKAALVVVNHPRTRMLRDDLDALVSPELAGVLLVHAVEPQDVRDLAALLREFEMARAIEPGSVKAFPVIDTARGLLRAAEIAAASPRIGGLVLASTAYAYDVGARAEESGPRLSYARGGVVAAARAVDALPLVESSAIQLRELAQYGFAGAIVGEVTAAGIANAAFQPAAATLERAAAAASAYDGARAEGAWVARAGEEVIDASAARRARHVLEYQ